MYTRANVNGTPVFQVNLSDSSLNGSRSRSMQPFSQKGTLIYTLCI